MTTHAKLVLPVLLIVAALAAVPATAPAAGAADVPALTKVAALTDARFAVKAASDAASTTEDSAKHRPACHRISRLSFKCTMRWTDSDVSGDRRWNVKILLNRSGPSASPVDSYRVTGAGVLVPHTKTAVEKAWEDAFGVPKTSEPFNARGRVLVETRRARLGQSLRLLDNGPIEPSDLLVTLQAFAAPPLTDKYGDPLTASAGTHYVFVPVLVENVGSRTASNSLSSAKAITTRDVTLESASLTDMAIDIPAGEQRRLSVAFEVPDGATVRQVEWSAGNDETGIWSM